MNNFILSFIIGLIFLYSCECLNCVDGSQDTYCSCTGPGSTCSCSPSSPSRQGLPCITNSVASDNTIKDSVSFLFLL